MTEKKFCVPAIIVSLAAAVLAYLMMPVEGCILGIVGVIMSVMKREKCRIKLPMILSIIAIIGSLIFLVHLILIGINGTGGTDYWFFELLFGKMDVN